MVIVIARFQPRPERLDEFLGLLRDVQAASRGDEGCVNYGYYREVVDELSFIAVEEWRDLPALEAHLRTPHVARLIAALPEHAARPPAIETHVIAETVPLPLPGGPAAGSGPR
jgi:quinol monooxygenase YgiN